MSAPDAEPLQCRARWDAWQAMTAAQRVAARDRGEMREGFSAHKCIPCPAPRGCGAAAGEPCRAQSLPLPVAVIGDCGARRVDVALSDAPDVDPQPEPAQPHPLDAEALRATRTPIDRAIERVMALAPDDAGDLADAIVSLSAEASRAQMHAGEFERGLTQARECAEHWRADAEALRAQVATLRALVQDASAMLSRGFQAHPEPCVCSWHLRADNALEGGR